MSGEKLEKMKKSDLFSNTEKAKRPQNKTSVFVKKKRNFTLAFLGIAALFIISAVVTNYDVIKGFGSIPQAFLWMAKKLVPNENSWAKLPNILKKLFETTLVSVAVTVCSAICAFFFSLLGTRTTKVNPWLGRITRIIASFFRNVPDVVWVMLLLFTFGQNILTGFFALFFYTFGMLTRTFIETID